MKRITKCVASMMALASLALLTSCGQKENAKKADENITLKWALWDWDATAYYKPLIDEYNKTHPNVKIEPLDLGSQDYQTMLSIQLTGGDDTIDVVTIKDIPGYNTLQKAKQLVNLNDFIKEKGINTSLYGGTTEQITVDGNLYALPFRSDFWVVFYNKALFDKAGVPYPTNDMTFAEYDKLARKMTSGSGTEKVYGAHYHTWRSAVQLFGVLDGKHTIVDGTYGFLKPYYETILAEQNDGIVQSYAQLKTTSTHYSGVFYNNSVAMMNMGSWFIGTLIQKVKAGEADCKDWAMVKYPHPEGIKAGTTLGTITSLGVSSASKKKEAALDFVEFVTGPLGAEVIAKTGTFPAIKNDSVIKVISSMDGFPKDENSAQALYTEKTYLEMPLHEKASEIEVILNQQHDNIMTGNISIDDGLAEMEKGVAPYIK